MVDRRAPAPWEYRSVIANYLEAAHDVLDIGTGGGEVLLEVAAGVRSALGIDIDPIMIEVAAENGEGSPNVSFRLVGPGLEEVRERFDVVLNRHAPCDLATVSSHLRSAGMFITQQVGERNMANIKAVLGNPVSPAPISRDAFDVEPLELIEFREYDVTYVVSDVDSLVFWLRSLDLLHADIDGPAATADVEIFNAILEGNVGDEGFVTNEHRYLAVARKVG